MTPDIIGPIVLWTILGGFLWAMLTNDGSIIDEDDISLPQLTLLRLLCGPFTWLVGLWSILGLFGKR